jgi:hypothetical protein
VRSQSALRSAMIQVTAPTRMLASRTRQAFTLLVCGSLNAPATFAGRAGSAGPLLRLDRVDGSLACVLTVGAITAQRRGDWRFAVAPQ